MKRTSIVATMLALSLLLAGCGGGGGGGGGGGFVPTTPTTPTDPGGGGTTNPPTTPVTPTPSTSIVSTVSGTVSDGPIENARVFIDLNGNSVFDEGEPFDLSDASGNFMIQYVLEQGKDYLLVAEGDVTLNTRDQQDNPGAAMNFVMFTKVRNTNTGTGITGVSVSQNINPQTFKAYLTEVDTGVSNALKVVSSQVKSLVETTETNPTLLFQQHILSSVKKQEYQTQLAKVSEFIKQKEQETQTSTTRTNLGLNTDTTVTFSTKETTSLTQELNFVNKTQPVKVGELVVASDLKTITTTSPNYQLFVSPYNSILEVPEYASLKNQGHHIVYGADITVKDSSGQRLMSVSDTVLLTDALNTFSVTNLAGLSTTNVDYYYLDGMNWTQGATNLTVSSSTITGLAGSFSLKPFVLVRSQGLSSAVSLSIPGYSALSGPTVIVKGYASSPKPNQAGSRLFREVAQNITPRTLLDVGVLSGSSFSYRVPPGFVVDEVTVMGQQVANLNGSTQNAVILPVNNTTNTAKSEDINAYVPVDSTSLKNFLLKGAAVQKYPGVEKLIQTRIAYEMATVSHIADTGLTTAETARNLIRQNFTQYLQAQTPAFQNGGVSELTWTTRGIQGDVSFQLLLNAGTATVSLNETERTTTSTIVRTKNTNWQFAKGKVTRTISSTFPSGLQTDSTHTASASYTAIDTTVTVVEFEDTRKEVMRYAGGYRTEKNGTYKGTAIFTDDVNSVTSLKSARFQQTYSESARLNDVAQGGVSQLSGLVTLTGNKVGFSGDYQATLESYGTTPLQGKVVVADTGTHTRSYDALARSFVNKNTLTNGIFSTRGTPVDANSQIAQGFLGSWQGTITGETQTCNGTGTLAITQNSQSWVGVVPNQPIYGVDIAIGTNSQTEQIIFFNESLQWGVGTLNSGNPLTITGTWSRTPCSGNFTFTKQ